MMVVMIIPYSGREFNISDTKGQNQCTNYRNNILFMAMAPLFTIGGKGQIMGLLCDAIYIMLYLWL